MPVLDINRNYTDACNVLAVVMERKYDKYYLSTTYGVPSDFYSYNQILGALCSPILFVGDISSITSKFV